MEVITNGVTKTKTLYSSYRIQNTNKNTPTNQNPLAQIQSCGKEDYDKALQFGSHISP